MTQFTPEDIAALVEALKPTMVEAANKAAAAHVTNRNKSYDEKLETVISTLSATKQPEKEDKEPSQTKQNADKIAKLEKMLFDEKQTNHRNAMRSSAEAILHKNRVSPDLSKAALAQLIYEDKLIELDDSGNAHFKSNSNGYDENLSLEEGITSWLKNNGKAFLLSPPPKGTGSREIRSHSSNSDPPLSSGELKSTVVDLLRSIR